MWITNTRGQQLAATLRLPDPHSTEIVILIPGLTCTRNSATVSRLAAELWRRKTASLTLEPAGCGDSDGLFEEFNLTAASHDVLAAKRYVTARGMDRVSVVGVSSGGSIAFAAASQDRDFAALAALAPVADYQTKRREEMGEDAIRKWRTAGTVDWFDREGKPHEMGYEFYRDAGHWVLYKHIPSLRLPILILHGGCDTNTPVADSIAFARLCPSAEVRVLHGADHVFYVNGRRLAVEAMVAAWICSTAGEAADRDPR